MSRLNFHMLTPFLRHTVDSPSLLDLCSSLIAFKTEVWSCCLLAVGTFSLWSCFLGQFKAPSIPIPPTTSYLLSRWVGTCNTYLTGDIISQDWERKPLVECLQQSGCLKHVLACLNSCPSVVFCFLLNVGWSWYVWNMQPAGEAETPINTWLLAVWLLALSPQNRWTA